MSRPFFSINNSTTTFPTLSFMDSFVRFVLSLLYARLHGATGAGAARHVMRRPSSALLPRGKSDTRDALMLMVSEGRHVPLPPACRY